MAPVKLRKYARHLQCMNVAPPAMVKTLVKDADSGLVNCICEVALNILKGNVAITPEQKRKLSRHKRDLRNVSVKRLDLKSKKRILQKGGFLPALLAPIARIVGIFILPSIVGFLGK